MVRQVQLTLPACACDMLHDARNLLAESDLSPVELRGQQGSEEVVVLVFTLHSLQSVRVIERLAERGFGSDHGRIELLDLRSSVPRIAAKTSGPSATRRRQWVRMTDRTSLEEIYQRVDESFHLTFDFLLTVAIAALVCAVGLTSKQATFVTASMLLSPLVCSLRPKLCPQCGAKRPFLHMPVLQMGPIMAQTLGACVGDRAMLMKGLRNELVGVFVCLVIGALVGGACSFTKLGLPAAPHDPAFESARPPVHTSPCRPAAYFTPWHAPHLGMLSDGTRQPCGCVIRARRHRHLPRRRGAYRMQHAQSM